MYHRSLFNAFCWSRSWKQSFVFCQVKVCMLCCFCRLQEHHGQQTTEIEELMLPTWIHSLMWKTQTTRNSLQLCNSHFNKGQTALFISAIGREDLMLIILAGYLLLHVSLVNHCTCAHTHAHASMHTHTNTHTHTCTHACMQTHTHTHTHTWRERERAICPNFYCALASEQLKDHTVSGVVGTE